MRQKGQVLIYNDQELGLIKASFAENDDLLYAIRKVLLQFPLTENEKQLIRNMSADVYAVVKKRLLPDLDGDSPLTQLGDFYQSINDALRSKSVDDMAPLFEAKKLELDYLTQQFDVLKNLDMPQVIKLDNLKYITVDPHTNYVQTTARNFLLSYVDSFLNMLKNLAGQATETPEQQKKRLQRDSNK